VLVDSFYRNAHEFRETVRLPGLDYAALHRVRVVNRDPIPIAHHEPVWLLIE
jgi:hypothetical protein